MKIAVSPANGSKNAWTVKKSAIASIFNATSDYSHHFGLNIPAGDIKKRLFSNLLGGLTEHLTGKTDFRKDAAMSKKRPPILLDLVPDWDEIQKPWLCPDCKKSFPSPLLTFISPLDGQERCPNCSDQFHRGKS